ncbi:LytR/AlgR family response regulator transcription factor [Maribellus sediminis]|uniref:LytR/AlgR family response regulator transcription factor n=1 Tax=Maribellus sediminis TaxID=2696285 RepID=UPI0014317261|nr:LytTR family DNA-binding domain-containing protein [Maribellus sediminis]
MKIRAIIVEDEKSNRENLAKILDEYCKNVELVALCSSAIEGRKAISELQPDLIFLDIEMPGGNGFSMLESLEQINFEVIFVTAFDHYGIKAVKFCALDYLLKPIDLLELTQAVDKVEKRLVEKSDNLRMKTMLNNQKNKLSSPKIAIPLSDKIEFVEVSSIVRCEGDGNYTNFFLKTGEKIIASKTLKEFDELLSDYNFLRVHQSHLINLNEVKSYIKTDGGYIKMNDGSTVSIARLRREMVLDKLKGM